MKRLITAVLFAFMASTQAGAGGAIGGGTGLIVRQDTPMISQSLFQALVMSGTNDEPILFNDLPAKVRTVNFEEKTVELDVEGQSDPTVLWQQETTPAVEEPVAEDPLTAEPSGEAAAPQPEAPATASEEAEPAAEPLPSL